MIAVLLTAEPKLYDASQELLKVTISISKDSSLSARASDLMTFLERTPHHAKHKGLFDGLTTADPAPMRNHDWPTQTAAEHIAGLMRKPALLAARALVRACSQSCQTKNDGPA
jgi:hypothetical protein